jgi:hypothetical protein
MSCPSVVLVVIFVGSQAFAAGFVAFDASFATARYQAKSLPHRTGRALASDGQEGLAAADPAKRTGV